MLFAMGPWLGRAQLVSVVAAALVGCAPQMSAADDSSLSPELHAAYAGLADSMALFVTDRSRDPAFPTRWAGSLYSTLVLIDRYDADPRWSSVREQWRSEVLGSDFSQVGKFIELETPKQTGWTEPWTRGVPTTGNLPVDALMKQFNFKVALAPYGSLRPHDVWELTSEVKVHTIAVAALWRPIQDVLSVEPDPAWTLYSWGNPYGVGESFTVGLKPGAGWQLKINYGWGDCAAGCIWGHTFAFDVTPDGRVTLSQSGEPLQ